MALDDGTDDLVLALLDDALEGEADPFGNLAALLVFGATAAVRQAGQLVPAAFSTLRPRRPARPASPPSGTQQVVTTLRATQAAMRTNRARTKFLAALVTRLYSEDQLRQLRQARVGNIDGLVKLDGMVAALTIGQVRAAIAAVLDENPSYIPPSVHADLRRVLRIGRPEPVRVARAQGRALDSGEFLVTGGRLNPGDKLTSPNGRYTLVMQPDGNLVGYDGKRAFWDTGTWDRPGCYLIAEPNGRFTLMTPYGTVPWSQASGSPSAFLCIQDDRNIVIYFDSSTPAAAWASHTNT